MAEHLLHQSHYISTYILPHFFYLTYCLRLHTFSFVSFSISADLILTASPLYSTILSSCLHSTAFIRKLIISLFAGYQLWNLASQPLAHAFSFVRPHPSCSVYFKTARKAVHCSGSLLKYPPPKCIKGCLQVASKCLSMLTFSSSRPQTIWDYQPDCRNALCNLHPRIQHHLYSCYLPQHYLTHQALLEKLFVIV